MRAACHPSGLPPTPARLVTRMPLRLLLALFILVPLLEMYLLIKVGSVIGAMPTILLVVFTAIVGVALLRAQGITTLQRVQQSLARGEVPALEMLEGAVLLVGAVLLLTPGFLTDAVGLLCLVPRFRRYIVTRLLRRYAESGTAGGGRKGPRIIEGDFHKED